MRKIAGSLLLAGLLLAWSVVVAGCSSGESGEKLPKKVVQAIHKQFPNAKILDSEKEGDEYEVVIQTGGEKKEVTVSEEGKILEIEEAEEEEKSSEEMEEKEEHEEGKASLEEKEEREEEGEEAEEGEEENEREWTFEKDPVGALPEGWVQDVTGHGKPGIWKVLEDSTAPSGTHVLAQTSSYGAGYHFNLAVAQDTDYKDLEIEVKFKAIKGREDRGGGPVWRYRDANNYYICRANPLESNYRVYKVEKGVRKMLGSARVKIPSGVWHSLRVVQKGNHIQCWYDGKKYLDVVDDTFPNSGKIGLWTKADAVTYFDNLEVSSLSK